MGANEVANIRHLALALRVTEYPGSFYDLGIRCDPIQLWSPSLLRIERKQFKPLFNIGWEASVPSNPSDILGLGVRGVDFGPSVPASIKLVQFAYILHVSCIFFTRQHSTLDIATPESFHSPKYHVPNTRLDNNDNAIIAVIIIIVRRYARSCSKDFTY